MTIEARQSAAQNYCRTCIEIENLRDEQTRIDNTRADALRRQAEVLKTLETSVGANVRERVFLVDGGVVDGGVVLVSYREGGAALVRFTHVEPKD